jgi:hypothetical protein
VKYSPAERPRRLQSVPDRWEASTFSEIKVLGFFVEQFAASEQTASRAEHSFRWAMISM